MRSCKSWKITKSTGITINPKKVPILMTSFAFIVGLMPLVFASGVGAEGNRSVATGAAVGQLIGTFFGLIVNTRTL